MFLELNVLCFIGLMLCVSLLKDKQMRVKYNNEEPLLSFIPACGASERDQPIEIGQLGHFEPKRKCKNQSYALECL